ncbi:MAG: hypothetical protein GF370_02825 [Candidatus Nealsonbacteria bacterium]|nr:hypothetical protein [Candidatus Nealsonbacteria bacterium]
MQKENILLVGLGYHARRIYFPILQEFQNRGSVDRIFILDLASQNKIISAYLKERCAKKCVALYLEEEEISQRELSKSVIDKLSRIISKKGIRGVIISTEPLAHMQYAKWALRSKLHILMDKPISVKIGASTRINLAKSILEDYEELKSLYEKRRNEEDIRFTVMAQRRFHPAFQLMKKKIAEVYNKTGCPVTSIQSFHCDGQWRMPSEIVDQIYHPYCQGYGKVSHSGYHSIDVIPWLMEAAEDSSRRLNYVDIYTNFVRPLDFLTQLPLEKYRKIFPDFDKHNKYTEEELKKKMIDFGEIDAFSSFAFRHNERTITLGSNNLAHSGFSQRSWVTAEGKDLYKGNGRVRHEMYIIEQGPFQSIIYLSCQGEEVNLKRLKGLYKFGGEYHLDIHIFRNDKMFPEWDNHAVYSIKDLSVNIMEGRSRGHQEDARRLAVEEFLKSLNGEKVNLTSELTDHRRASVLSSGVYQSAILRKENKNPMITLNFEK